MRIHLARGLALAGSLVLLAAPNLGQTPEKGARVPPKRPAEVTLADVRAVFRTVDADRDGRLSGREPSALPWGPQLLRQSDQDGDGAFSFDEFVVGHHRHLVSAGQAVARDVAAESTRVQAVWRARRSEELKRLRRAEERGIRVARPSDTESVRTGLVPSDRQRSQRVVPEARPAEGAQGSNGGKRPSEPPFKGPDKAKNAPVTPPVTPPAPEAKTDPARAPADPRAGPGPATRPTSAKSSTRWRYGPKPAPASNGPAGQRLGTPRRGAPPPAKPEKKPEKKSGG